MPLLRFDLIEGRPESDQENSRDETHDVLLEVRQLPKHGRYRVVTLDALTDPKVWYR